MWDTSEYCWVVICKNHKFHHQKNQLYGHRIPLGVTDAFTPRPALSRLKLGAQILGSKPRAAFLARHSLIARFPTTTYNFRFRPAPPDAPGSGVACPKENSAPRSKR